MRFNLGNSSIINIFVMPDQDDGAMNSPFQGFLVDVFSDDYFQTMTKTLSYPINATEVFMSQQELIEYRCEFGFPNLFLLNIRSLAEMLPLFINHPFVCITCIGDELKFVKSLDLQLKYSPLIIGIEPEADLDINRFNIFMLDDFLIKRTNEALNNGDLPSELSKYINNRQPREKKVNKLKIPTRAHSVTHPNELVLMSVGFGFEYIDAIRGSGDENIFINAILDSSRNLQSILNYRKDDSKSDLIIYSPSIFTHLYNFKDHFWNQINRELKIKSAKSFIMNGVFKNPAYSGMDLDKSMIKDMKEVFDNKAFQAVMGTRQFELAYTTLAALLLKSMELNQEATI